MIGITITMLIASVICVANHEIRPTIYQYSFLVMALFGILNGYVTSRNLKFFGTTDWVFSALCAAFGLPTIIVFA